MLYANYTDTDAGDKVEKDILALFRKHSQLCYAFKLVDTAGASRDGQVSFVQAQPSDYIVSCDNARTLYIEVKASRVHPNLAEGVGNVRASQAAAARRVHKLKGEYYFIFVDRTNHTIQLYNGNEVSLYYRNKKKQPPTPLLMHNWSGRVEFIHKIITGEI